MDVVRAIAIKLKTEHASSYDRVSIAFYQPGMTDLDAGCWATARFDPNLDVEILGVSSEQETKLKNLPMKPGREIVGSWLDERPGLSVRIVIYRREGKVYCDETFKDGSGGTDELVEKVVSDGIRFDRKNISAADKEAGTHWLLDRSGNLQMRDNEGVYGTAKKFP